MTAQGVELKRSYWEQAVDRCIKEQQIITNYLQSTPEVKRPVTGRSNHDDAKAGLHDWLLEEAFIRIENQNSSTNTDDTHTAERS